MENSKNYFIIIKTWKIIESKLIDFGVQKHVPMFDIKNGLLPSKDRIM